MKKYSWIVALLIALSLAVLGCPTTGEEEEEEQQQEEMEWKTVWELATDATIQALTVADTNLVFGTGSSGAQPIKPLIRAGENDTHVTVKAVAGPGDQAVALEFTSVANWGAGLDLLSSAFGFQEGDKLTVKGEVLAIGTGGSKPQFQVNARLGGENTLKSTEETGAFDWEITLDAAAIATIKQGVGGDPSGPMPGIRLSGNGEGTKVKLDNIKIEGNRPSNLKTLEAPVIELDGTTGVKWTAVEGAGGYKVFLDDATEPVATLGAAATSVNLKTNNAVADGTYTVTVIATGETGVSKDSPKSNEVTYTKVTPPGGSVFSLAEWLVDIADGPIAGNLTDPLIKSGSPTITKSATGLAITSRTNDYFGVDVDITKAGLDLDNNVYTIVVTGTGDAASVAKIGQTGSPYGEFKRQTIPASGDYVLIGTVSATNNAAKTNIRIQTADTTDFTISNIEIFSGAVFDLAEWLVDIADGPIAGNLTDPLIKSGSPTITKSATGLAITSRTNDYFGVDVDITKAGLDLDNNIYKIFVTGTGDAASVAKIGQTGSPYGEFKRQTIPASGGYILNGTVSATNNAAKTNIRIQTADTTDFTISNILIWVE